jgi:B9 domain-containing protein 2
MAEVHLIGTILGASEFSASSLCCRYDIIAGDSWTLLEGNSSGQTHVDSPSNESSVIWNQPIDLHFNTKSLSGWPKLAVKVFNQDLFGRNVLCNLLFMKGAYGFTHIPSSPGIHTVDIHTWRPVGTKAEEIWTKFLGTSVHLVDESLVYEPIDRFRLLTKSMGKVHTKVMVVVRNFKRNGIAL